jgi:hypothetical protein
MKDIKTQKTVGKLTRAQVTEALDSVPVSHIIGKRANKELTGKQKAFALEVAKGSSGAEAYRKAYKTRGKTLTQANEASRLKARPDVAAEIEAYKAAIDAETYRTPAGLRSLIIQSLVQTIIDPDTPPAVRVQAAKVAGQITEVGLYTERKEVRTITSSEDARAKIMAELKQLANADAVDVLAVDADADSLLAELAATDSGVSETHPHPTPQTGEAESLANIHTIPHEQDHLKSIPHEQTPPFSNSAATPSTDAIQDDPPSSFEK